MNPSEFESQEEYEEAVDNVEWLGAPKTIPTEKQIKLVFKIINFFGFEKVKKYIKKFYPSCKLNKLTRKQAQKIITGLDHKLPKKPIRCSESYHYWK